jgi:uncharacterized RDD family membrane protein YckC
MHEAIASSQPSVLDKAGLGQRATARLIDVGLVGVVASAIGVGTGFGVAWLVATASGTFLYFVTFDLSGATPGKRLVGLRVRSADEGRNPTIAAAASREAFVLLGAIPFAGPILAAALWASIALGIRSDAEGRAWHDRLGHTMVTTSSPRT